MGKETLMLSQISQTPRRPGTPERIWKKKIETPNGFVNFTDIADPNITATPMAQPGDQVTRAISKSRNDIRYQIEGDQLNNTTRAQSKL